MRLQFIFGYILSAGLLCWTVLQGNFEFLIYGILTALVVTLLLVGDKKYSFNGLLLWGFNLWIVLHLIGGLFVVHQAAMYSYVIVDIVGEPYSILKYDQLVHAYCYYIIALLLWQVMQQFYNGKNFLLLAIISVLTATGIGGLNEIIEFIATVLVPDTNVGGYENTAIDIVCNLIGACLAVPFFRKLKGA